MNTNRILIVRGGPDALGKAPHDDIPLLLAKVIEQKASSDTQLVGLVTKSDFEIDLRGLKIPTPFSDEIPLTTILKEGETSPYPCFGHIEDYLKFYPVYDRIMDRMLKIRQFTSHERRNIFWWLINYANRVLDKTSPTHIIFPVIPHFAVDYIFYVVSIVNRIEALAFENLFLSDMIWLVDIQKRLSTHGHDHVLSHAQPLADNKKQFIADYISKRRHEYVLPSYESAHKERSKVRPRHYLALAYYYGLLRAKRLINFFQGRDQLDNLRAYDSLKLRIEFFRSSRQVKAYEDHALKKVPDFRYVLFALHDEPERVLVPMCSPHDDQIALAVLLAGKLKVQGIKLVVREHPAMFNAYRSKLRRNRDLYALLAKIDNIYLSSPTLESRQWVLSSLGVVTGTGTIGLEAAILSKPVLAFGFPWYGGHKLVYSMSKVDDFIRTCAGNNHASAVTNDLHEHLEKIVSRTRIGINEPSPAYNQLTPDARVNNAKALAEIVIDYFKWQ